MTPNILITTTLPRPAAAGVMPLVKGISSSRSLPATGYSTICDNKEKNTQQGKTGQEEFGQYQDNIIGTLLLLLNMQAKYIVYIIYHEQNGEVVELVCNELKVKSAGIERRPRQRSKGPLFFFLF